MKCAFITAWMMFPDVFLLLCEVLVVVTWLFEAVSFCLARQRCAKACDLSRQKQTPGEQKLMCIEFHITCSSWECLWRVKAFVWPTIDANPRNMKGPERQWKTRLSEIAVPEKNKTIQNVLVCIANTINSLPLIPWSVFGSCSSRI